MPVLLLWAQVANSCLLKFWSNGIQINKYDIRILWVSGFISIASFSWHKWNSFTSILGDNNLLLTLSFQDNKNGQIINTNLKSNFSNFYKTAVTCLHWNSIKKKRNYLTYSCLLINFLSFSMNGLWHIGPYPLDMSSLVQLGVLMTYDNRKVVHFNVWNGKYLRVLMFVVPLQQNYTPKKLNFSMWFFIFPLLLSLRISREGKAEN